MMKTILIIVLAFFSWQNAFATGQIPDKIIYDGKEYKLHSNPLETFFKKNPGKRPKGGVISTGLWRGYVATFEARNSQLFLKDIEIEYQYNDDFKWRSVLKEVFPDQTDIKVDWLTGILVIPHGELVDYVHMGYGSTYEKYILLEIDKGDLKKEKFFEYREYEEFRERQFYAFKKTEEYGKLKADLKKDGQTDEFIDSFLRNFIIEYTSKILE